MGGGCDAPSGILLKLWPVAGARALSALPFEALSDGCGKRLASRLPRDRNAVIRRRARTLGLAMRRTRRGLQPRPSKWSARRKVSATLVNVGFRLPAVGNTELPAT